MRLIRDRELGSRPASSGSSSNRTRGRLQAFVRAGGLLAAAGILVASACAQSWGQGPPPRVAPTTASDNPKDLQDVRIDQRLNEQLPLDAVFRDEDGTQVKLGDFFGKKPVVLALVYYSCPMLCDQVLNGMTSSLDVLKSFDIGKEFEVVTVSFDPKEGPDLARQKKETYLKWYKRDGAAAGWHFLTGDQANISRLTDAAGFHYKWDEKTNQFIHASGIMVVTPEGKLARYFYGIEYAPRDLRLGLVEASASRIGNPVDQLLLYCYHYDPASGKYGAVVINIIRLGGAVTLLAIVAMFVVFKLRASKRADAGGLI
jgi:protein SCO1/2